MEEVNIGYCGLGCVATRLMEDLYFNLYYNVNNINFLHYYYVASFLMLTYLNCVNCDRISDIVYCGSGFVWLFTPDRNKFSLFSFSNTSSCINTINVLARVSNAVLLRKFYVLYGARKYISFYP